MTDNPTSTVLDDDRLHRFARQLILPGFDEEHQLRLAATHMLIIGAGGLGAPVIQYLIAAGIGTLTIVDDDVVDRSNLNRQVIHPERHIDMPKVDSAILAGQAMDQHIQIHGHRGRFDASSAGTLCQGVDVIVDASDNPDTRLAANDAAHHHHIPLVFGGAVRLEGQVASFRSGIDASAPCYRCLFPEAAGRDLAPGCSEAGILGPITGAVGSIMALEAIKQALMPDQVLGSTLDGRLLLFDGRYMSTSVFTVTKSADCPCCAST